MRPAGGWAPLCSQQALEECRGGEGAVGAWPNASEQRVSLHIGAAFAKTRRVQGSNGVDNLSVQLALHRR